MRTLFTSLIYAFIFACLMLAGGLAYEIIRPTDKPILGPLPDSYSRFVYPKSSPTRTPPQRVELISVKAQEKPTKEEILQEIDRVFTADGNEEAGEIGKRVAYCESRLLPTAQSRTGDTGIFQISWVHKIPIAKLKDYKFNIQYAYKLYQKQGFTPWKYSRKCWDKKGV